jgi:hypothetical protein
LPRRRDGFAVAAVEELEHPLERRRVGRIGAIDDDQDRGVVGPLDGRRQPDRLALGMAVGSTAMRQERIVAIAPEQPVELVEALAFSSSRGRAWSSPVRVRW